MWQLDREATSASSGSTPAGFDSGSGTAAGDDDAITDWPPSKDQVCSREYLPRANSPVAFHAILARCSEDMRVRIAASARAGRRGGSVEADGLEVFFRH